MRDAFGGGQGNNPLPEFNLSKNKGFLVFIAIILIAIAGSMRSFAVVDSRERGIVKYAGKVSETVLTPGIQFAVPFVSEIRTIDVMTKKLELEGVKIYTKDQQSAVVDTALNYNIRPTSVVKLYKKLGSLNKRLLEDTIIFPVLKSTITNELGKWTAEQVVTNKAQIAQNIYTSISEEMGSDSIVQVTNFEVISIDLDDEYEIATRNKVIAEQKAQTSKNKTRQIEEEARQKIIQAQAEAESMKIRTEALRANRSLIEYEAVQKWDGHLPQYMMGGESIPFIGIPAGTRNNPQKSSRR